MKRISAMASGRCSLVSSVGLKARLISTCAVSLSLAAQAAFPGVAQAQAFQGSFTTVNGGAVRTSGTATVNGQTVQTDRIEVTRDSIVLNWTPTDTSAGGSPINFLPANFIATFNRDGGQDYTVLNRILPTGAAAGRGIAINGNVLSLLNGSAVNGSIWFYSPNGVLAGPTASFVTGGLVLTTLDHPYSTTDGSISFGSGGAFQFGGPGGTTSPTVPGTAAILSAGATVNAAIAANSYVAIVAPRVEQRGAIAVDGGVALVAAEQVQLNFAPNALFDVAVTIGTSDPQGIVHTGSTLGAARQAANPGGQIALVAVPKNDALTMLVSGILGYQPATSAAVDNGVVVLSGGYGLANGALQNGATAANAGLSFNGATTVTSDTVVRASGAIGSALSSGQSFTVSTTETTGGTPVPLDLTMLSDGALTLNLTNSVIRSSGDITLGAGSPSAGANLSVTVTDSGGPLQSGAVGPAAAAGIIAGGNLLVAATASGNGPSLTGGNVTVTLNGSNSRLFSTGLGTFEAAARATPPVSGAAATTTATGGTALLDIRGGTASFGTLSISAEALGGASTGPGGNATGGSAELRVSGGALTATAITVNANATGGAGAVGTVSTGGQTGGRGSGGTARLITSGGTVTATGINAVAIGTGGDGGTAPAPLTDGGAGGAGEGGIASVDGSGGLLTVASLLVSADAVGGNGGPSVGEPVARNGGAGGSAIGGSARAANVSINDPQGSLAVSALMTGGAGGTGLNGGNGGDTFLSGSLTTGAFVDLDARSLSISQISVLSSASGGTGGNGSTLSGTGGNGGSALGGQAQFTLTGTQLTSGTITVSGSATGNGGGLARNGGAGGNAGGGFASLSGSSGALLLVNALELTGVAFGGFGAPGSAGNPATPGGGTGGAGGNAVSGGARFNINGAGSSATIDTMAHSTIAFGGDGGAGGNGTTATGGGPGGSGGNGGNAVPAGSAEIIVENGANAAILAGPDGVPFVVEGYSLGGNGGFAGLGTDTGTDGNAGTGGAAVGSTILVSVDNATLFFNRFTADSSAYGGGYNLPAANFAQGGSGDGTGGSASIFVDNGSFTSTRTTLDVRGFGGDGHGGTGASGGDGTGGLATIEVFGASTLFAGGPLEARASGAGGTGGSSNAAAGGQGGTGGGGLGYFRFDLGTNIPSALINVSGVGGRGGSGRSGGAGGSGFGGSASGGARIELIGGSLEIDTTILRANGTGGQGGTGTAGSGGAGGIGTGGAITILADGDTASLSLPSLDAIAAGAGGAGGASAPGVTAAAAGSTGGSATGGAIDILAANEGVLTLGGIENLIATATGGNGGTGSRGVAGVPGTAGIAGTAGIIGINGGNGGNGAAGGAGGTGGDGGSGGNGGAASGGSISFIATAASILAGPVVATVDGIGGTGGAGGTGGSGGRGGDGGAGGRGADDAFAPGNGGNGGNAGNGGQGGNGGVSGEGGTGQGGIVTLRADAGSVELGDLNLFASGIAGDTGPAGIGGTGGEAGYGGAGGAGGETGYGITGQPGTAGAGGLTGNTGGPGNFGNQFVFGSGGLITLESLGDGGISRLSAGNTTLAADGRHALFGTFGIAGTITFLNRQGTSTPQPDAAFLSINASADGFAGGLITFTAEDARITSTDGGITGLTSGNISVNASGSGQVAATGDIVLSATGRFDATHSQRPANLATITGAEVTIISGGEFDASDGARLDARGSLFVQSSGSSLSADVLTGVTSVSAFAAGDLDVADVTASGTPSPFTSPAFPGTVDLRAGLIDGLYAPATATVSGAISSTGDLAIRSGGDVLILGSAALRSDNRLDILSGDDIVIAGGATLSSGLNPIPEFGYGATGALNLLAGVINSGLVDADEVATIIIGEAELRAAGQPITLSAEAIDARRAQFEAGDLFASIFDPPAPGIAPRNDGGLLSPECLEGDLCIGTITAAGIASLGPESGITGLPNRIAIAGNVSADSIIVRGREDIVLGPSAGNAALAAASSLFVASTTGNLTLLPGLSLSSDAVSLFAAGSIAATGGAISASTLGLGADALSLGAITVNDALNTIGDDGQILTAGSLVVPGEVGLESLTVSAGSAAISAGGNIGFGSINAATDVTLSSGGTVTGTIASGGDDIRILAPGTVALTSATIAATAPDSEGDGRNLVINAAGGIALVRTAISGAARLTSAAGAVEIAENFATSLASEISGTSVLARATGAMNLGTVLATSGNISLTAVGNINAGNLRGQAAINLTSSSGDVAVSTIGGAQAPAPALSASLSAADEVSLGAAAVSGLLSIRAGNLFSLAGQAVAGSIDARSGNIALGAGSQLGVQGTTSAITLANTGGGVTFVGGPGGATGYGLSAAELQRLFATDITIIAPRTGDTPGGQGATALSARPPDVVIDAFSLEAGAGRNLGSSGRLLIQSSGKVRTIGAALVSGLGTGGRLEIQAADAIEVDAASGSITLRNASGGLGGTLVLTSEDVISATLPAIAEIAAAPDMTAINDRIDRSEGAPNADGTLRADGIVVTVSGGFYVQNTSGVQSSRFADFDTRRGLTVGAGGLRIVTSSPAARIAVNGRQQTSSGFVVGKDFLNIVSINGQSQAEGTLQSGQFDFASTINACRILSPLTCTIAFDDGNIARDIINRSRSRLRGSGEDEAGGGAGGIDALALVSLRDVEEIGYPPLIDDPVTGAGNDDLWAIDDAACPEGSSDCPK